MTMRHLVLSLVLAGCSASAQPPAPAPPADPPPPPPPPMGSAATAAPASCTKNADCPSGICEGLGCDDAHPGTCAPAQRICTRDARPYCGCDGQTFFASGTCPAKRFASRSKCGE